MAVWRQSNDGPALHRYTESMYRLSRVRPSVALSRLQHRRARRRGRHFECAPVHRAAARDGNPTALIEDPAAEALRSVGLGSLIQRKRRRR
jgi:hypothetical protein